MIGTHRTGFNKVSFAGAARYYSSIDSHLTESELEVLSKALVVRRCYLDRRRREGHRNAVVFFVEMKRSLKSNIFTGCRVGSKVSSKVHFRRSKAYKWAIDTKHVTKDLAFVDCFDIAGIKDGDSAFLRISHVEFGSTKKVGIEVRSQRNLIIPESRNNQQLSHPSVLSCVSTIRMAEIPPSADGMLYQWLRYQKTIGVDHVHMIAEDTFVKAGGFDHSIIKKALKDNFLSIDLWPKWFNETEIYHSSQHMAATDCVYRFQGVYDYVIISDSDEFLIPRGKSKSIKPYLKKWCSGRKATCVFEWHQFYPDSGWTPQTVGPDGNLTATVRCQNTTKMDNVKSAHQLRAIVEVGRHGPIKIISGYSQSIVPMKEAYFGHLRKQLSPPPGLCNYHSVK